MIQIKANLRTVWIETVGHVGTLFLSILMGIIVWLIAINQVNPLKTEDFADAIPIEVRGLNSSKLQLTQDLSKEYVKVRLRAPLTTWEKLTNRDLTAYIDVTGLGKGGHDVAINVVPNESDIAIVSKQRQQLRIELDDVITKTFPVEVNVLDGVEYGYSMQTPLVNPPTIDISGPAVKVNEIARAEVPINLTGVRNQVELFEKVIPRDRQNQTVPLVSPQPPAVDVTVPVERWPNQRPVAVRVKLIGQPAYGYRLGRVTADPSSVMLYGDAALLEQVPGVVETAPLSLDGATANIRARLSLILPEGVNVFEGDNVSVVAEVFPVEDGRTIPVRPVVRNLGENFTATIAPDTVDVILSGPLNLLISLNPDDVYVLLDVQGMTEGSYVIKPNVAIPDDIHLEGVLPETVEVVISARATPTETLQNGTLPPPLLPTSQTTPAITPVITPAEAPAGTTATTPAPTLEQTTTATATPFN
ncbi:MAG: CdaR family protein [Caldilineaceae bacterium]